MWRRQPHAAGEQVAACDGSCFSTPSPAVLRPVQHGGDIVVLQLLEQDDADQEHHARRQAQRLWYLLLASLCACN